MSDAGRKDLAEAGEWFEQHNPILPEQVLAERNILSVAPELLADSDPQQLMEFEAEWAEEARELHDRPISRQ